MGKAIARKSHKALAQECFDSPAIRKQILNKLGTIVRRELKKMCS